MEHNAVRDPGVVNIHKAQGRSRRALLTKGSQPALNFSETLHLVVNPNKYSNWGNVNKTGQKTRVLAEGGYGRAGHNGKGCPLVAPVAGDCLGLVRAAEQPFCLNHPSTTYVATCPPTGGVSWCPSQCRRSQDSQGDDRLSKSQVTELQQYASHRVS